MLTSIITIADAITAIERIDSAPRALPCPGCPSSNAMERLTMHVHTPAVVEATAYGAIRLWACADCRHLRALDFVAIPLAPRAAEALPC